MRYEFAEPPPYDHQMKALRKMVETRGKAALLYEPGLGKSRVVLDYLSMLAMKQGECRALVVCPLAVTDTWLSEARRWVPRGVAVWGEVLGGRIEQKGNRLRSLGPEWSDDRSEGQDRADTLKVWDPDGKPVDVEPGPDGLEQPRIILTVTNHETFAYRHTVPGLSSVTVLDRVLRGVEDFQPDVLICDESHKIKGHSSNTSKAMARAGEHAPRRIILTGTPMPHSPLDVYGQWRFLDPSVFATKQADGSLRTWSWFQFRNRYAIMGGWMGKQVIGYRGEDDLREHMAANAVYASKDEELDLPPTHDESIDVHLDVKERRHYREMVDHLATRLREGELATVPNRLAQLMRLRQITAGHLPVDDPDSEDDRTVEQIGSSKVDHCVSLATDVLGGERRLVIFGYFRHEIAAIAEQLRSGAEDDEEIAVITGDTPTRERLAIRERFADLEDGPRRLVLVAQVRTVSLGINELVTASHAIFTSLSERRDEYVQAKDRLDRPGQERPVTFWHLIAPGTVDEVMLRAHQERTNLEEAIVAHIEEATG